MAQILAIPFALRLVFLLLVGCALGAVCNWATYSFAYHPRSISPWSRLTAGAAPRRWSDRIPVIGWFGLARETPLHGRGFWLRPLVVELLTGFLLAGLYWWETREVGLLPAGAAVRAPLPLVERLMHANFLAHALLILFMLVASLIDLDEKTIPDLVTIPGTLAGLLVLALLPAGRLPEVVEIGGAAGIVKAPRSITLASPNDWPAELGGAPIAESLVIGLACYLTWCFGLLPRSWRTRHGLGRALWIFAARIVREPFTLIVAAVAMVGVTGIVAVWWIGGLRWESLLSSLVGLAAGGGIVWIVRIIGRYALRKEAMGFGDVTLLAMIGSFLGWQACLFVFFLAPFAGLLLGIAQWIAHREHELPYGPFLCLAALFVIANWAAIWPWAQPVFEIAGLVPAAMAVCMVIMLLLLTGLRWMRGG